jgi:class 3 adenylate cyclase
MEPRIQYAQTTDGVSIAYWTLGEGAPLLYMPRIPFSHIQLEWQILGYSRWYERLAENRRVVRYDGRGSGLSDRDVTDFSLEAHVRDLEAVSEHLGIERFALFARLNDGPVALTYAARYPNRISQLILWCSLARGSDLWRSPRAQAFRAIRETDWDLYTEVIADLTLGRRSDEEESRLAGEYIRECVTQDAAVHCLDALAGFDASALLSSVRSPTLVLHRRSMPWLPVDLARRLASGIRDSRLVMLEGASLSPFEGNIETVASAIDEFLGEGEHTGTASAPSGLVTILFTDMEGSTTLTQRLGDARAQEVLRTHNAIVRDALKAHDGSETKHTGDGIMASFSSASRALECSIAIQRAFAVHNAATSARPEPVEGRAPEPIRVRIGLNAGEPVAEEQDLFGTAVQLAARICAHAEPEQILAPIVVRELAAGKRFLFADLGDVALRGFEDPVRLFELRWREQD